MMNNLLKLVFSALLAENIKIIIAFYSHPNSDVILIMRILNKHVMNLNEFFLKTVLSLQSIKENCSTFQTIKNGGNESFFKCTHSIPMILCDHFKEH